MKFPKLFALCFCLFYSFIQANKIVTVNDLDWENPLAWQGSKVPENPDTIIVRHYITFNQDLNIAAPTVLIIEKPGVLCGNFSLDIACGAKLINYSYLYVKTAYIRAGHNYFEFYAKDMMTFQGCPPNGFGYFENHPPDGHMWVWPPVLCRTIETHWAKGSTSVATASTETSECTVFPNPVNDKLTIELKGEFEVALIDLSGRKLIETSGKDKLLVGLRDFPPGIFYLRVTSQNKIFNRKIVRD